MAKEKDNSWIKWLIVAVFLFAVIIVSLNFGDNENEYISHTSREVYTYSGNVTNVANTNEETLERIVFSGMNQNSEVSSANPSLVVVSGMDNNIKFIKNSNPKEITLGGMRNKIILCRDIHSPKIDNSGLNNEVDYVNC
ncbi:hypothetical protein KAT36_00330 [Candidatus Pacearchaeota archaeon]|nr:hypothetical protein [Candidatus Pacearchaeota archaeon]